MTDLYQPRREDRFSFGLWTVGNPGRDPFARGSMRSYLIYKEKARRWNADREIQALVKELSKMPNGASPKPDGYSKATAARLKAFAFDRKALGERGLMYERLDQLTVELILGVR